MAKLAPVKRKSILLVALLTMLAGPALAGLNRAEVTEPSRGDPKVFASMARQGFEKGALKRGTTLVRLCTISTNGGSAAYTLYWFYHLTQAAQTVHGRAELVVISAPGRVLGVYGYDGSDRPRCAGGRVYPVDDFTGDDPDRYVTTFGPDQLPEFLGDGGSFYPVSRFQKASSVDGIRLPRSAD